VNHEKLNLSLGRFRPWHSETTCSIVLRSADRPDARIGRWRTCRRWWNEPQVFVPAVVLGLLVGWSRTRLSQSVWQLPDFQHAWVVAVFFVPQLLAFYLPVTRTQLSTPVVAACLIISQIGLLLFCFYNKHLPGISILAAGLLLNLLVISVNGGLMPLSTTTASYLIPEQVLSNLKIGSRFGFSKDVLLAPEAIIFPWLSDRFVPPTWIPYRFIFSFGDILIAIGAFWLLAFPPTSVTRSLER